MLDEQANACVNVTECPTGESHDYHMTGTDAFILDPVQYYSCALPRRVLAHFLSNEWSQYRVLSVRVMLASLYSRHTVHTAVLHWLCRLC